MRHQAIELFVVLCHIARVWSHLQPPAAIAYHKTAIVSISKNHLHHSHFLPACPPPTTVAATAAPAEVDFTAVVALPGLADPELQDQDLPGT